MKAISLWQPYASLIAARVKRHETRHWPPPRWLIGQRIAIHAAKRLETDLGEDLEALLVETFGDDWTALRLPRGAIVATATLANCYPTETRLKDAGHEDIISGDWSPGRFAWRLTAIRPVDPPMLCRGAQGLWDWKPGHEQTAQMVRVG